MQPPNWSMSTLYLKGKIGKANKKFHCLKNFCFLTMVLQGWGVSEHGP